MRILLIVVGVFVALLLLWIITVDVGEFEGVNVEQPPSAVSNRSSQPGAAVLHGDSSQPGTIELEEDSSRQAWVGAEPHPADDGYRISVSAGPYKTQGECEAQLSDELQKALDKYVDVCLADEPHPQVVLPTEYLRGLIKDKYEEVRDHEEPVGRMVTEHYLLVFDQRAKDRIMDEYRRATVSNRLLYAGLIWGGWLALLGGAYGVLKMKRKPV